MGYAFSFDSSSFDSSPSANTLLDKNSNYCLPPDAIELLRDLPRPMEMLRFLCIARAATADQLCRATELSADEGCRALEELLDTEFILEISDHQLGIATRPRAKATFYSLTEAGKDALKTCCSTLTPAEIPSQESSLNVPNRLFLNEIYFSITSAGWLLKIEEVENKPAKRGGKTQRISAENSICANAHGDDGSDFYESLTSVRIVFFDAARAQIRVEPFLIGAEPFGALHTSGEPRDWTLYTSDRCPRRTGETRKRNAFGDC